MNVIKIAFNKEPNSLANVIGRHDQAKTYLCFFREAINETKYLPSIPSTLIV